MESNKFVLGIRLSSLFNPRKYIIGLYNICKLFILKLLHPNTVKIPIIQHLAARTTFDLQGRMIVKGKITTSPGVVLTVRRKAELWIGDNVFFNRNVIVVARDKITIGRDCMFGPGVMFYDHDHRIEESGEIGGEYLTSPINIGNHCWIGANAIVLRGTVLGDHCIVGAGTIVKGVFPPYSMIYNNKEIVSRSIIEKKNENIYTTGEL